MGHALGINFYHAKKSKKKADRKLPKEFYRNRFCASDDHDDMPTLVALEKMGYMERGIKINDGTSTLWFTTELGEARFRECFEAAMLSRVPQ